VSRNKVSPEIWEQAKIAFASGTIGLRELARKMNIPQGTMTARASREGWTKNIEAAKRAANGAQAVAVRPTVMQSVAESMQKRGQRHMGRIAGISERVVDHVETMQPGEVLGSIHEVEKLDRMARRTYGLGDSAGAGGTLALNILTNQAAIVVSRDFEVAKASELSQRFAE
jgi:hypothetical protein